MVFAAYIVETKALHEFFINHNIILITFINKSEYSKSFLKNYIYIYKVSIYNFLKSLLSFY